MRCFKAKVLEDYGSAEINQTIKESIDNQSIIFTDKSTSYVAISQFVKLHILLRFAKIIEIKQYNLYF